MAITRNLNKNVNDRHRRIAVGPALPWRIADAVIRVKSEATKRNEPHSLLLDTLLFVSFRIVVNGGGLRKGH
jgi:hypothetical protein